MPDDETEVFPTPVGVIRVITSSSTNPRTFPSVPVQPIFSPVPEHKAEYPMFEHLARYPHVLPIYRYDTPENLIADLPDKIIRPAEDKVKEIRPHL